MRVALGSDHAGFALKEAVKAFLSADHREVIDLGTFSTDPVDYSDYAKAVGRALRHNQADRGILLCGSGVGASMAANRIPGIRAGLCHDTYSAHQGVEHIKVLVERERRALRAHLSADVTGGLRTFREAILASLAQAPTTMRSAPFSAVVNS
jgi:RpiB/LacA/LacB family sugar-phosphate isomerase